MFVGLIGMAVSYAGGSLFTWWTISQYCENVPNKWRWISYWWLTKDVNELKQYLRK